jgi:hypothetical protein
MFKHVWSVLCERISIDQNTNLVSYLTSTEGFTTESLPIAVLNLAYGTRWYKEGDGEEILRIRLFLVAPDGSEKELITGEQKSKANNHRTNIMLNGLFFEQSGDYMFKLQMQEDDKWVTVHEMPLTISVKTPEKTNDTSIKEAKFVQEKKAAYSNSK